MWRLCAKLSTPKMYTQTITHIYVPNTQLRIAKVGCKTGKAKGVWRARDSRAQPKRIPQVYGNVVFLGRVFWSLRAGVLYSGVRSCGN